MGFTVLGEVVLGWPARLPATLVMDVVYKPSGFSLKRIKKISNIPLNSNNNNRRPGNMLE